MASYKSMLCAQVPLSFTHSNTFALMINLLIGIDYVTNENYSSKE